MSKGSSLICLIAFAYVSEISNIEENESFKSIAIESTFLDGRQPKNGRGKQFKFGFSYIRATNKKHRSRK